MDPFEALGMGPDLYDYRGKCMQRFLPMVPVLYRSLKAHQSNCPLQGDTTRVTVCVCVCVLMMI